MRGSDALRRDGEADVADGGEAEDAIADVPLLPAEDAEEPDDEGGSDGATDAATYDPTRFITRIVSFTPGPGAGFGSNRLPNILYGPPRGGERAGL